ncbi:hypothetical protein M5D96_011969, partial [Drosophila gunungcola]
MGLALSVRYWIRPLLCRGNTFIKITQRRSE